MYNCQQHLKLHLRARFDETAIATIEEYSGQLADAEQIGEILPAVLIMFIDGRPMAQEKEHEFSLLVITENRELVAETAANDNLDLSSQVSYYLRDNYLFPANGRNGSYEIVREQTRARTLMNGDRFCIVEIQLLIKDFT